ncbi:MAG: hypothetical protein ACPG4T_10155 [Nannocystaceae bacterium]
MGIGFAGFVWKCLLVGTELVSGADVLISPHAASEAMEIVGERYKAQG